MYEVIDRHTGKEFKKLEDAKKPASQKLRLEIEALKRAISMLRD
jgi:hypothetical protein